MRTTGVFLGSSTFVKCVFNAHTQAGGLHSGGCVDSVSKQTVPWHLVAHYPCHAWTCVVKNSKEGDKEVARLLSVVTVLVSLSMNWNNLRP